MSPPGCQKMSATPCNRNAEESFPVLSLKSWEQKPPNSLLIQDKNVLQPTTPPWRELFHIPYFCHPCAGPAGLQAVGPAHVGTVIRVCHERKASAALGDGDHHRHGP